MLFIRFSGAFSFKLIHQQGQLAPKMEGYPLCMIVWKSGEYALCRTNDSSSLLKPRCLWPVVVQENHLFTALFAQLLY